LHTQEYRNKFVHGSLGLNTPGLILTQ
jgi:hypothetical protein